MRSRPVHRIALLISLTTSFGRRILEGVNSHPSRVDWELLAEAWGDVGSDDLLSGEYADGLIVDTTDNRFGEMLQQSRKPTVVVAGAVSNPQWASVTPDFSLAGRLAAEHFIELGFHHLAFLGTYQRTARELCRSFTQVAGRRGIPVSVHTTRLSWRGRSRDLGDKLGEWLRTLHRPCGVFAADDIAARRVLQACRRLGLRVPPDIAVLGMGDYEMVNTVTRPPLSTVVVPAREIGVRAAECLARLLGGQELGSSRHIAIPPQCIAARKSTDVLAWSDPLIVAALDWLKLNMADKVRIPALAQCLSVSRRLLELHFHRTLGHGPAEELRRIRLRQAQRLLRETDWNLRAVARACGLHSSEQLCSQFRQRLSITPGRYRLGASGVALASDARLPTLETATPCGVASDSIELFDQPILGFSVG